MATYNFELNNRPTKRGTYVVMLRITENKKHKRIKTSVELKSPKYWNQKAQEVRKSEPDFKVMNKNLEDLKSRMTEAEHKLEEQGTGITSIKVVKTYKAKRKAFSFLDYASEFSERTFEAGDYRTYTKYITFLNKLRLFINGIKPEEILSIPRNGKKLDEYMSNLKEDLLFNEINLTFLNKFKAYLQRIPNSKNPEITLHQNTISKQFDNFKSLYNKGIIELKDEGLEMKENPFANFQCDTIDTNKEKLTWEEIESLKALELEEGTLLWHTRNCFMLAFYCAGMRAGDLIQLRGTNIVSENGEWRISYRMDKTSATKDILLLPEALSIITQYISLNNRTTDYIFPLLDNNAPYAKANTWESKEQLPFNIKKLLLQHINAKNSLLNKYLSKLALMAGIEKKVSMHIARHSFANIARQKKANVYDISKVLGHSSLKITESYLSKFDTASQDATMKQVFNNNEANLNHLRSQLQHLNPEELSKLFESLSK